jgi:putative flippase GtrA
MANINYYYYWMSRLLEFMRKLFDLRFTRFFISGSTAFLCDTLTLNLIRFVLKVDFDVLGVIYFSKLTSSLVGISVSFILNKKLAFNDANGTMKSHVSRFAIAYFFSLAWGNLLFSGVRFLLVQGSLGDSLASNVANIIAEGTKMFVNFFVYKYFVFK